MGRISELFTSLDNRFKSADKKDQTRLDQTGVKSEGKGGGQRIHNTESQTTGKRSHERETGSTSNVVPTRVH